MSGPLARIDRHAVLARAMRFECPLDSSVSHRLPLVMTYIAAIEALADPTRRHIFESLRSRPKNVGELAASQTVSRPAVSQHLKVLQQARLVTVEPHGTKRVYAIRSEGLEELRSYLDSFGTDILAAFAAEITLRQTNN
jgi:DNA-binding transcriptional ArsR family regulator